MLKSIHTENAPKAVGPYSQAIEANNLLFVSGQLPIDPSTMKAPDCIEEQTHQCFKNAQAIIKEANYNFSNVVKVTVLLDDIQNFQAMNSVYEQYFQAPFPARIAYEVAKLPLGVKVEIDFIVAK